MLDFFFLLIGLACLWLGAELVIRGALNVANYLKVSQIFIGVTILAIGTDLPELVVAIDASILQLAGKDASGIIIGNAIGSSLNQITLVLGTGAIVGHLFMTRKSIWKDGIVLLGSMLVLFLVSYDGTITQSDGIILLVVYGIYYLMLFYGEFYGEEVSTQKKKQVPTKIWQNLIYLLGGLALVAVASDLVVDKSINLAKLWGVPQSYIALVFIALGTSLPELVLTISASFKKAPELSVGNIIGSNIFDLLVPVGIGAAISVQQIDTNLIWGDLLYLFAVTVLILTAFYYSQNLSRIWGFVLVFVYAAYVITKSLSL